MFLGITIGLVVSASAFAGWLLLRVHKSGAGSPEMLEFSKSAQAAFLGPLKMQAGILGAASLAAALLVYLILAFFTYQGQVSAVRAGFAFLAGVLFQGLAGIASARIYSGGALRTAAAAGSPGPGNFVLALRTAGASSIATLALGLAGLIIMLLLTGGWSGDRGVPLKIAGFGFGSAFAALFPRLAGGTYTEGAGWKRAQDALGLGADLFGSASAANLAAMILGASLWPVYGPKAVIFPLFAGAWSLVSCAAGVMFAGMSAEGGHIEALDKGLIAAGIAALSGLFLGCSFGLDGNMWIFMASLIGLVSSVLFASAARYYGGHTHRPARMVTGAASGGAAPAFIRALSYGFESAAAPAALTAAAVIGSYYCGVRGLEYGCVSGGFTERACGLYGVAAAAAGMLSVSGYILSLGVFGTLSGEANAVVAGTHNEEAVQAGAGALAAAGRTAGTAAGGYAGAAAVFAAVLLFLAYMVKTSALVSRPFETVNFAGAEGFVGGFIGAMLVFLFCAYCLRIGGVPGDPATGPGPVFKRLAVPAALALALPPVSALFFRGSGLSPEVLSSMLIAAIVGGALLAAVVRNTGAALVGALLFMEEGGEGGSGGPYRAVFESCSAASALQNTAAPALNSLVKILPAMALLLAELFV